MRRAIAAVVAMLTTGALLIPSTVAEAARVHPNPRFH
jgi:hypothetical protein